jgi:hypothetical protein
VVSGTRAAAILRVYMGAVRARTDATNDDIAVEKKKSNSSIKSRLS